MRKIGRPQKKIPEKVLETLITNYLNNYPTKLKLKYREIYEYANQFKIKGEFEWPPSYEFWRREERQGRLLIDDINSKLSTISEKNSKEYVIVSTKDVFEEYSENLTKNKDKIIAKLKVNEYGLKRILTKHEELEKKYENVLNDTEQLKSKVQSLEYQNSEYEQVIFQLMDISNSDDISIIVDLITTNLNQSKLVTELLKNMFREPDAPYYKKDQINEVNNLIPLKKNKKNTLIDDLEL